MSHCLVPRVSYDGPTDQGGGSHVSVLGATGRWVCVSYDCPTWQASGSHMAGSHSSSCWVPQVGRLVLHVSYDGPIGQAGGSDMGGSHRSAGWSYMSAMTGPTGQAGGSHMAGPICQVNNSMCRSHQSVIGLDWHIDAPRKRELTHGPDT